MVRMVHCREEKEGSDLISVGTKSETDNRGPGVATWVVQRLHRDATWTIPTIQNLRAPRAVGGGKRTVGAGQHVQGSEGRAPRPASWRGLWAEISLAVGWLIISREALVAFFALSDVEWDEGGFTREVSDQSVGPFTISNLNVWLKTLWQRPNLGNHSRPNWFIIYFHWELVCGIYIYFLKIHLWVDIKSFVCSAICNSTVHTSKVREHTRCLWILPESESAPPLDLSFD